MKLSRKEFKKILKECILELQEEGLLGNSLPNSEKQINESSNVFSKQINPNLLNSVKSISGGWLGRDKSLMENIFMDTALTTLQQQHETTNAYASMLGSFLPPPPMPSVSSPSRPNMLLEQGQYASEVSSNKIDQIISEEFNGMRSPTQSPSRGIDPVLASIPGANKWKSIVFSKSVQKR